MNEIEVFNDTKDNIKEIEDIKKVMEYASEKEGLKNTEFSIILVEDKIIQEINYTYRGINKPTDVISFALEDEKNMPLVEGRTLGDIYISIDKAKVQALEYEHSLKRELCFLSVHGLLHLLGYDHMDPAEENIMFTKQKEILDGYGIYR